MMTSTSSSSASASASASGGFSVAAVEKKLKDLNTTIQSIQGVSQWLIHYRKYAKTVISVWYKEMHKADSGRKLTLLYVANDVIQNSKKKGPEYRTEFVKVLPRAFQGISKSKEDSLIKSTERIINVWEERHVFDATILTRFKAAMASGSGHSQRRTRSESDVKRVPPPEAKRAKLDKQARRRSSSIDEEPPNSREPPEAEALLKRMMAIDGDKSVAQDTATRLKIAGFSPELYDSDILTKIKDKAAADAFAEKVEEASKVIAEYNKRLEGELKERQEIQELLAVFIWQQKKLLKEAKKNLKEFQSKQEKVTAVKEELKSHLANLPDLSRLPMGTKTSLTPLPSVGDLFT